MKLFPDFFFIIAQRFFAVSTKSETKVFFRPTLSNIHHRKQITINPVTDTIAQVDGNDSFNDTEDDDEADVLSTSPRRQWGEEGTL